MSALIPYNLAYPKSFFHSYAQIDYDAAGEAKCVLNSEGKSLAKRIAKQKLQKEQQGFEKEALQTAPSKSNISAYHDRVRDLSLWITDDEYKIHEQDITDKVSEKILERAERDLLKDLQREEVNEDLLNRVSHIARVPICLLGVILHAAKTVLKAVICIPVEILTNKSRLGVKGVKTEAALTIGALFRTAACFNPKDNDSFLLGCSNIGSILLWEATFSQDIESASFTDLVNICWEKAFNPHSGEIKIAKLQLAERNKQTNIA